MAIARKGVTSRPSLNIIARVRAAVEEPQHDLSFLIFAAALCVCVC